MVLSHAAIFFWHMKGKQALRGQGFHVLSRKDAVAVAFDHVGRERSVAELDQFALYFFLFAG